MQSQACHKPGTVPQAPDVSKPRVLYLQNRAELG